MAVKVYGQNQLPGDIVSLRAGSTVAISLGFDATLGLVGNMDVTTGTATPGVVEHISDSTDALEAFGENSELHQQTQLAYNNNAADLYAVGVVETEETESFTGASTGVLQNAPICDPQVAPEHEITVTDTIESVSLNVVFEYGETAPQTPGEPDTIAINTVTGEWTADTSSDYDITYQHGDYQTAIVELLKKNIRNACVLTESESVGNDLLTELNTHAQRFDFMRGIIGGMPETLPTEYEDAISDMRMSVVEPARAYTDATGQEQVRLCGPVAAHLTSRPLSESATGEIHGRISGLVELNNEFTPNEGADFVAEGVLPVLQGTNIHIAKDMTTSEVVKFKRVYAVEIAHEIAFTHHLIAEQFVGSFNYPERREELETSLEVPLIDMQEGNPPLLSAFVVNVTEGASDFEVDAEVGVDIVGIMDRINVQISLGDVVTLEGIQ